MLAVHGYHGGWRGVEPAQLKASMQKISTFCQRGVCVQITVELEALQEPLVAVTVSVPEVAVVEKLAVIE